ncbi:hypothetical protein [Streptomyces iconiensis]|uniref:DUF4352 domain-containing protein n=1 Tax=Streptomyces iconiensis TaxID=1384038 RepID=A0ABT6ZQ88_9ACTN|nr:hypothetical protein [Streptomyces iconiensis]MDJ1131225.1 hypothetical protein [Streptomyces iconiensis]
MRRHIVMLAVVPLLMTAACASADDGKPESEPAKSKSVPKKKPKPNPADEGPLPLGKVLRWSADRSDPAAADGAITALTYRQPVPGIYGADSGEEWARLEVKVCIKAGDDVRVSQFPWFLAFADGSRVEVTGSSGGDFPRPEFPMDAAVKPGDCAKGGIMFPVPKGQRADRAVYEPDGGEPVEWKIPKR